jgi:flagellin-specific chaperone FliS
MMEARLERDADKLDSTRELLGELREAWAEVAGA